MNLPPARALRSWLFACLWSALLCACATSGTAGSRKAEAALSSAQHFSTQLGQLAKNLESSGSALDGLRQSVGAKGLFNREKEAKADIPAAFKSYQKALEAVRASAK